MNNIDTVFFFGVRQREKEASFLITGDWYRNGVMKTLFGV